MYIYIYIWRAIDSLQKDCAMVATVMLRNDRGERPKKAFGGNQQSDEWNQKVDVCNINKNKVLIHLIILESSISDITDEGVLSRVYVRKGLMSKA